MKSNVFAALNHRPLDLLQSCGGLAVLLLGLCSAFPAEPLGSAFTYQGRLNDGPGPANGSFDLRFSLHDAESGGSPVGAPLTRSAVVLTNGLFGVTLDFGATVFAGEARWLEIAVRPHGPAAPFVVLAPRQPVGAAPYSQYSIASGSAAQAVAVAPAAIAAPQLATPASPSAGQVLAFNGTSLAWSNPAANPNAWLLSGNAGTTPAANFLGTTDNQPLQLRVNGQRALRLEPTLSAAPNLIGGAEVNFAADGVVGAVIAGGGALNHSGEAFTNSVEANFATIAGGAGNWIGPGALSASVGGGSANWIGADSLESVIAGGNFNTVEGVYDSFIGGGYANYIGWAADYTVIAGGFTNAIGETASYSVIAGGTNNVVGNASASSVIGGGEQNAIGPEGLDNTIAGGGINEIGSVYGGTIAGGYYNLLGDYADYSTIGGGYDNWISDSVSSATIPGGQNAACFSYGQLAYASGAHRTYGDAQTSLYVVRNSTTNATTAELFLDGLAERIRVPEGGSWTYQITLVARSGNGNSASFEAKGGIKNIGGNVTLIGASPTAMTSIATDFTALPSPAIQANNASDALVIRVTGLANQVIRWVARVQTAELIY